MTQRVRVTFTKEGPLRWVAHLDLMRTWERTIRRATLPLTYSHGFSPHAKIALAAPLPVGVAGSGELIDLWLDDPLPLGDIAKRLSAVMPPGLSISALSEVSEELPSLQSCLLAAHYEVTFDTVDRDALDAAVARLLVLDELAWEEQRGEKVRRYDLRATVLELSTRDAGDGIALLMHLSLEVGRTGRPAQVLKALDIEDEPLLITRTAIEFADGGTTRGGHVVLQS